MVLSNTTRSIFGWSKVTRFAFEKRPSRRVIAGLRVSTRSKAVEPKNAATVALRLSTRYATPPRPPGARGAGWGGLLGRPWCCPQRAPDGCEAPMPAVQCPELHWRAGPSLGPARWWWWAAQGLLRPGLPGHGCVPGVVLLPRRWHRLLLRRRWDEHGASQPGIPATYPFSFPLLPRNGARGPALRHRAPRRACPL